MGFARGQLKDPQEESLRGGITPVPHDKFCGRNVRAGYA